MCTLPPADPYLSAAIFLPETPIFLERFPHWKDNLDTHITRPRPASRPLAPTTCAACGHPTTGVITTNGVMTTWLMVAASAHVAAIVVEHQRRLLGPLLLPRLKPNSESVGASHVTARFPPPQVRGTAIFPPIFLERQTSSDPYLSIYLSRRVDMGQRG